MNEEKVYIHHFDYITVRIVVGFAQDSVPKYTITPFSKCILN